MRKPPAFSCPSSGRSETSQTAVLLNLLGRRNFKALQRALGGRRIWIPKGGARIPCAACSTRDECIRAWKREGRSVAAISRHLGISPKTSYRVIGSRGSAK